MNIDELKLFFNSAKARQPWPSPWEFHRTFHPMPRFIRNAPPNAKLLDFGAGTGGLADLLKWPQSFSRKDIQIYAYSLEYVSKFNDYIDFQIGNFDIAPPKFSHQFDALICSHVIEHLQWSNFIKWIPSILAPNGLVYIEWPSEFSIEQPSCHEMRAAGVDLVIGNFHDDRSHIHLPERGKVIAELSSSGFLIIETGYIRLPSVEEELMAHGREMNDENLMRMAFWSRTLWCQFIIAQRVEYNAV